MNVLFVIHTLDYADHISLGYLSAIAKQLGHHTHFCCLAFSSLAETVKNIRPDVVAYSANIVGFSHIVKAHSKAKKCHNFISIMGGPHTTFSPNSFRESGMDAYCIGEGELAFRDFLLRVENQQPFFDIDNIVAMNLDGNIQHNPVRPLIGNLDDLPLPDRDLVLEHSYLKYEPKKTFYTTRGCPYKCSYCYNNYYHILYKGKGSRLRRFSVDRVLREMTNVFQKYRMNFVKFGDDLFAWEADDWVKEFAEKYPHQIGVPFNCYLRIDLINENLLKLLKQAGCYSVHLSIDSLSQHVRTNILNRQMKNVDCTDVIRMIHSYKIRTWVNFMLAVPDSTLDDDLNTIRMSKKSKITYTSYTTAVPMNGTPLYDYCIEKGILSPDYIGDLSGVSQESVLSCFSKKEKQIRYNVYLLGAFVAKLPQPLFGLAMQVIKVIPPNRIFHRIYHWMYAYYVKHKVFKLA